MGFDPFIDLVATFVAPFTHSLVVPFEGRWLGPAFATKRSGSIDVHEWIEYVFYDVTKVKQKRVTTERRPFGSAEKNLVTAKKYMVDVPISKISTSYFDIRFGHRNIFSQVKCPMFFRASREVSVFTKVKHLE